MVRKKLKKPDGSVAHGLSSLADPAAVVFSWLRDLKLSKHDHIPAIGPDFEMFSLLQGSTLTVPTALAQVNSMRTLRAAIVSGEINDAAHLRMLFLASMLLYIDSTAHAIRKSLKELLLATEEACAVLGSCTSDTESSWISL